MTTINHFRQDNTEGYSEADLAELNARFAAACAMFDADPLDAEKSLLDYIGERVLAAYDDAKFVATMAIGDRVEGGDTTDDYDTGTVHHVAGDDITVTWDSGVRTTQPSSMLRPEGANPHREGE